MVDIRRKSGWVWVTQGKKGNLNSCALSSGILLNGQIFFGQFYARATGLNTKRSTRKRESTKLNKKVANFLHSLASQTFFALAWLQPIQFEI